MFCGPRLVPMDRCCTRKDGRADKYLDDRTEGAVHPLWVERRGGGQEALADEVTKGGGLER